MVIYVELARESRDGEVPPSLLLAVGLRSAYRVTSSVSTILNTSIPCVDIHIQRLTPIRSKINPTLAVLVQVERRRLDQMCGMGSTTARQERHARLNCEGVHVNEWRG